MHLRLFAAIILASCAYTSGTVPHIPTPKIYYDALLKIQNAFALNPSQRNVECFIIYLSELQAYATNLQDDLSTCDTKSKDDLTKLQKSKTDEITAVATSADSGCSLYSECSEALPVLQFFECYTKASKESSAHFSSTKSNAESSARDVKQTQNAIAYEKDLCDTKCNDDYLRKSDNIYDELQKCLQDSAL